MNSHESALLDIAKFALKRHKTPERALAGFVEKLWNNAPLMRTVVGVDVINAAALAYLKSVPAKAGVGGVRPGRESQFTLGPADTSSSGDGEGVLRGGESQREIGLPSSPDPESTSAQAEAGGVRDAHESHAVGGLAGQSSGGDEVRELDESHIAVGPSSPDPNKRVPVVAHKRNRPGNAKRGLAEVTAIAATMPELFAPLADGKTNVWTMTLDETDRLIPDSSYNGALGFLIQRHVQVQDRKNTVVKDVVHREQMDAWQQIAKDFTRLVNEGVEITIGAYAAMESHRLEASNAA